MESLKNNKMIFSIGMLVMLYAGLHWSHNLSKHLDLLFGDEAEYMRNGLDLFKIVRNDWGPSYNIWYKFLSLFNRDVIELYYLNYAIGAILVGVLIYVYLFLRLENKIAALYISFCFFVSSLNINTWPRISHFVLILVLSALIASTRFQSRAKQWLLFSIVTFVCAYARPDLLLSFLLTFFVALYFIKKEFTHVKSFLPFILVLVVVFLFFQLYFGLPSSTYKGGLDRLYSAFCQHYTINYKMQHKDNFDAVTEWITFCKHKFPECKTVGDVVLKHPSEFMSNLFLNMRNYLLFLLTYLVSFIFPIGIFKSKKALLLASALFFILLFAVLISKKNRATYFSSLKKYSQEILFLLIFGLPSLGMSWVIFPRAHYSILHILLFVLLLAIAFDSVLKNVQIGKLGYGFLCLLLLVISPVASKYPYMQFGNDMHNLCEQKLIRFLEEKKDKPQVVMTNYLNVTYLLPKNYTEFSTEFDLHEGMYFDDILKNKKISIILMSENIIHNPILETDTTWNALLAHPELYNFKKVVYSKDCESYLLIKE